MGKILTAYQKYLRARLTKVCSKENSKRVHSFSKYIQILNTLALKLKIRCFTKYVYQIFSICPYSPFFIPSLSCVSFFCLSLLPVHCQLAHACPADLCLFLLDMQPLASPSSPVSSLPQQPTPNSIAYLDYQLFVNLLGFPCTMRILSRLLY